jgi:hypothetical protein
LPHLLRKPRGATLEENLKAPVVGWMVSLVALCLGAPAPAAAVTVTWKITGTFLGEQNEVSGVFNSTDTPNLTAFISFNITAVADSTSAIQATYGAGGGAGVPNVTITYVAGDGTGP